MGHKTGPSKMFAELFDMPLPIKTYTTKPTTGLSKGDLFILFHGSMPKLAVCSSTAGNTIKMIRLKTKSLGRATA
jgi:hypothetical protein